ncbi:hypothetical protein [Pantoea sp. GD03673]|uniref:hypothetical protein n=1 Tax=Pantoea sp. GD03673 TaxID=2975364 RepID=UPI0024483BA0|nr:hypothetical protein [Pantoea sp. GD03673]MDH2066879.1 hypothetical protein [Pantoea sp. GD03673]
MKKLVKNFVILAIALAVLALAVMISIVVSARPSKVGDSQAEACRHYDNQAIMTRVIRAKTRDESQLKNFSDVQDLAEKNGILIDYDQISFGNDIWLVPFSQRSGQSATEEYIGLLDCTTDSVEFSKK